MRRLEKILLLNCFLLLSCGGGQIGFAQNRIGDICTVKGQERNMLRGVGLVVGLAGTGDPNLATTGAALAEALSKSGWEIPRDASGQPITEMYKNDKNAALVYVTAEIPAAGARQGSVIQCQVHSWGQASNLAGGTLLETALTGGPTLNLNASSLESNRASQLPVLAVATGRIRSEGGQSTSGMIDGGCQLTVDFRNQFYEELTELVTDKDPFGGDPGTQRQVRYLNLVVKQGHADFATADRIAQQINDELIRQTDGGFGAEEKVYARALDSINIRVRFPEADQSDPVGFVRYILEDIPVVLNAKRSKIVLNRRTGVITVGEDVYFSPVAITSGEFKIDVAPFRELTLEDNQGLGAVMKLKRLTQALNDLQAPPGTIIDIIKHLEAGGHLYGQVIEQ
jgi:flagellar P-ring protein precursor FlgI